MSEPSPASSVSLVIDGSSGDPAIEFAWARAAASIFELFKRKQRDYGPYNIGLLQDRGVLTRITDKFMRLNNLYYANEKPLNEDIEDTWADIADYAIIALLCMAGHWVHPKLTHVQSEYLFRMMDRSLQDRTSEAADFILRELARCVCQGTGTVRLDDSAGTVLTYDCQSCTGLQTALRLLTGQPARNQEPEQGVKHG